MGQRAYCDQDHPGGDAEADRWCESYHAVERPRLRETTTQIALIVDATTGEQYAKVPAGYPVKDFKGWLMRSRGHHRRRTGHKLIVRWIGDPPADF